MSNQCVMIGSVVLIVWTTAPPVFAQEPESSVAITITPAETPLVRTQHRLLPADADLHQGNAAVVMLRMIWEQQGYMQNVVPQIPAMLELPYDDPSIPGVLQFDRFEKRLRCAAYLRDADWNYPFDEEPHALILLPDVQGLRTFAGRGMTLWIGSQIAAGELEAAREGILVQLACARHLARTPIMVNHLVADAIAESALDRTELLVQQDRCPNLYWALALLPRTLGDYQRCLEWESNVLKNSLESLTDPAPRVEDDAWIQISEEFLDHMQMMMDDGLSLTESGLLLVRLDAIARQDLSVLSLFSEDEISRMSHNEAIMRWVLYQNDVVHAEIQAAFTLPAPKAIAKLRMLENTISEMMDRTGAPAAPFSEKPVGLYFGIFRFERRVKMLQVVEAIRDHLTRNDGSLPNSLADIHAVHVPNDPLTDNPFQYQIVDGVAHLKTPSIPEISPKQNAGLYREYVIAAAISR